MRNSTGRWGCLGALLALGLGVASCAPAEPEPLRGAVLVVLDTLLAEHVSAYGSERETTPQLDRLAQQGVLFEAAISNSSWTLPAMAGMLSGSFPSASVFDRKLSRSLVEPLRGAGFRTAAFTEGGFVSAFYGLERGFDVWQEVEDEIRLRVAGEYVHEGV